MTLVEIAEASIDDAEEVSALAVKTYVDAWGTEFDDPDDLAWHLERTISVPAWRDHFTRDRVLVARIDSRPVGFVQFGPADAGGIEISRLYVVADLQGQGIGSDLLQRALAAPEVSGASVVQIDVWQDNSRARQLYERFGFRYEGGRVPFVLKSGEIDGYDLILVRRRSQDLGLIDGRRAFSGTAATYDGARPPYPDWVFDILAERCGLGPGTRTFEVGAGTGLATRPLLARGAAPLVAIEPDARLGEVLRDKTPSADLKVIEAAFEDVALAPASFDLGCSATAFHWVDQRPALAKVAAALRPGGAWAMWWNVYGDPEKADAFHEATQGLLGSLGRNPSNQSWRHPFALDRAARIGDLQSVGAFTDIAVEQMDWSVHLDANRVRALYATYSHIAILPTPERERILDGLHDIATTQFCGAIERSIITIVYTCRRT